MPVSLMGKHLVLVRGILLILGLVMLFSDKIPNVGNLPGDIHFSKGNFSIYVPVVTMLVISLFLTTIVNLFGWSK